MQDLTPTLTPTLTLDPDPDPGPDPADWQRRPWWRRQLSEAAYAAVRVVLGMLGAGRWA